MAPVPKDSRDKPNDSNSNMDPLHNPNLIMDDAGNSDTDSDDGDINGMIVPGGYSLLPSEPGALEEDSDSETEDDWKPDPSSELSTTIDDGVAGHVSTDACSSLQLEETLDLASAAEGGIPTLHVKENSGNPAARQKYPQGKIPSYLHVPNLPKDKTGFVWNDRKVVKRSTLEMGHESAILKAMSGFQLPPESIPPWAKDIPEEKWRQQIKESMSMKDDKCNTLENPSNKTQIPADVTTAGTPDDDWVAEFPQ